MQMAFPSVCLLPQPLLTEKQALGEGAASPLPLARGSGERFELLQRGLGRSPDRP